MHLKCLICTYMTKSVFWQLSVASSSKSSILDNMTFSFISADLVKVQGVKFAFNVKVINDGAIKVTDTD